MAQFQQTLSGNPKNSPYYIGGDITIETGVTLTIESGVDVIFLDRDDLGGGYFSDKSELIINGQIDANEVIFTGPANSFSLIEFNSAITVNSGANFSFNPNFLVSFNQNVTLNNGGELHFDNITTGFYGSTSFNSGSTCSFGDSTNITFFQELNNSSENLIFGNNSHVDFNELTTLNAGSLCTFGDSADVEFKDDFSLLGSLVFGDYSHITFYKEANFDSLSYFDPGHNSTIIYKGVTVHGGDTDVPSNSTVCYEDTVIFISGVNSTFRSDVIVTYHKPCVIDSGAVVNYTHDVTALHKSDFKVYGKFWADNSILDFGDDSTTAPGVVFEGEGASLSRITDSMIKDGVDGFTITNASPLIKTSEVRSVVKRGFNISGIDAEPEIRECYVHNCGTYPVQVLYEADPVVVDSRLYGGSKSAARIWGADGEYSRNEFRSVSGSGAFLFSSSANPMFYSFADSGGNVFDMNNIGAHGVFIGGGFPEFGHNSYYNGYNSFENKGGKYYFYNDTPGTILAELNWWPDGTSFYNADGGSIDFLPRLTSEPPSGPLSKTAVSPYATGFEKFREKDY
ncbi:hypothetical protein JXQ31_08965, partial [candidate division KSB1 bacterium]|nr:hypothetical protein [candidate division KSB1 bacterium]